MFYVIKLKNITFILRKLLIIFKYRNIILFVEIKTKIIQYLGDMENEENYFTNFNVYNVYRSCSISCRRKCSFSK